MSDDQLTVEEFVARAFEKLRAPDKGPGLHVVYSNFMQAFREYYPDLDPREELKKLADARKIVLLPRKGGPVMYKPEEAPSLPEKPRETLKKMGL